MDWVNGTNTTNMLQVTTQVNQSSNYLLGTLLVVSVFIGVYFLYKKEETAKEFLISGFVSSIVAVLFILINWITWQIFIALIFVFFLAFMITFFTQA